MLRGGGSVATLTAMGMVSLWSSVPGDNVEILVDPEAWGHLPGITVKPLAGGRLLAVNQAASISIWDARTGRGECPRSTSCRYIVGSVSL